MTKTRNFLRLTIFMIGFALLLGVLVFANALTFDLSWWTIDNGGKQSSGGSYSITGVIGQPDAGSMSGGNYAIEGGFLHGLAAQSTAVHDWQRYGK